jgi:hypothetical protein
VSAHTLYELTPSQELSMLNRHWTLHKSIVNIATSVTFDAPLERHLLAEAIRLCVLRWDASASTSATGTASTSSSGSSPIPRR